ncbi:DUF5641 domain-containing protein, partial [Trichonephila clavipes]
LGDNDIDSLNVLTPSHFLVGEEIIGPSETVEESKLILKGRWDIVQKLKLNFSKRWQIDYLNSIQRRTKWKSGTSNIKIGDVVIIKEDNLPPSVWPLGKVISTHPGITAKIKGSDLILIIFHRPYASFLMDPIFQCLCLQVSCKRFPGISEVKLTDGIFAGLDIL